MKSDQNFSNQLEEMQKAFCEIYEINKNCIEEIKMLRMYVIDQTRFVDSTEKKWFTNKLMSEECGIRDIKDYVKIMLKGYRKTH